MSVFRSILRILALAAVAGCAAGTPAERMARSGAPDVDPRSGVERNFTVAPDEAERLLSTGEFEIVEQSSAGAGVTGAYKLRLHFPAENVDLNTKWKPVPSGDMDSWNNSPRKELAAYRVQFLFLDDDELIVPTTVARCIPLDAYERVDPAARATVPGTACVLGVFALWLDDVRVPERVHEDARFFSDGAYAHHMANFNLLTYLIDHRDGRAGNFLVSTDDSNRRIFAVDNGIAFNPRIYNFFVPNWHSIRVPALRRESIERLRAVRPSEVQALGVVAEMRVGDDGILVPGVPGPNLDSSRGSKVRYGIIQFGLEEDEIEELRERIDELIEEIDDGDVAVY